MMQSTVGDLYGQRHRHNEPKCRVHGMSQMILLSLLDYFFPMLRILSIQKSTEVCPLPWYWDNPQKRMLCPSLLTILPQWAEKREVFGEDVD